MDDFKCFVTARISGERFDGDADVMSYAKL